ncbi:hypothetical protein NQ315_012384 [Exocentrus adspersus]|uniref:Transposable element P transposase n=1 Tax=Exocentrus adspersus TaxID=1586481 RepID=A0AAV8VMQ8_9CUCU|nr:hypothetical protein NQ315_012384 [Exocentrus adspersus]
MSKYAFLSPSVKPIGCFLKTRIICSAISKVKFIMNISNHFLNVFSGLLRLFLDLLASTVSFLLDSFIKMKVKVAANQLSHTVAASIETFSALGLLPSESLHTAEFVHDVDNLFDSLNGTGTLFSDGKQFRCSLSEVSPHLEFWSKLLPKIKNWKLIDLGTSKDCTKQYHFVEGWQLTIRSVIYIWNNLRQKGLRYLSLRSLNQDPLQNLFGQIRQHGISNSNPTCHQFVAALKTVVVNNLTVPLSKNQNCEDDNCTPLGDFCSFLLQQSAIDSNSSGSDDCDLTDLQCYSVEDNDNQGTTYVAGYILSKIKVPDCEICRRHLYSPDVQQNHLFVTFKEYDDKQRLTYASDNVVNLIELFIHTNLYNFLDKYSHCSFLENKFKEFYADSFTSFKFCDEHNCLQLIIDKAIRLTIYKYLKEHKTTKNFTSGHTKKMKKFKAS